MEGVGNMFCGLHRSPAILVLGYKTVTPNPKAQSSTGHEGGNISLRSKVIDKKKRKKKKKTITKVTAKKETTDKDKSKNKKKKKKLSTKKFTPDIFK